MRKVILSLLPAAVLAGAIATAASASAATSTNQRFIVIQHGANNADRCTVVAIGPIHGAGTCTTSDGATDSETLVHLALPSGTVELDSQTTDGSDVFTEQACVDRFRFSGTYTLDGGTGAFTGARGSGSLAGKGLDIAKKTAAGCDFDQARLSLVVRLNGTTALGG